jgi:Cu2+-exporting ATPase
VGESTQLAAIVRLLDKALAQKPDFALLADRIAGGFVLALLIVAAATFVFWWQRDPEHALPTMVAVLVISCPCALSLATPAALTAAMGCMAREGLLVTRSHALEALPTVTDVVFDKTGTLTAGQPVLRDVLPIATTCEAAQSIAAGLEGASEHPLARAIRTGVTPAAATDFENHPGEGVSAAVEGIRHWLGRSDFVARHCRAPVPEAVGRWQSDQTVVWLVRDDVWLAGFAIGDAIRPEVAHVLAALPTGLTLHVLSGDSDGPVQSVARTLGIAHARAGARPTDKLAYVQALQAQGRRVLMVGDGINDAPVLAAADVSLAVGGATEAAQAAGDLVLLGDLDGLPAGIRTARKTRRIIRQNLAWALGYNLVALPVAIAGWVTPWLASLGMAASSLIVVLNATRLAPRTPRAVKQ